MKHAFGLPWLRMQALKEHGRRFKAGESVEAQNENLEWRAASIERFEPYRGREGYYILWALPADAPSWVSRGGWKPGYAVREVQR